MKGEINKIDVANISDNYGIDIESELTSMLSDELAKSIDAEIMKNLLPLIFFIFLVNSTFSQSAIGQLEEITGQKINRYSSSGTGYYNPSPPPGPEFYNGQYKDFIIKLCNDENQKAIKFFSKKN